MSFWKEFVERIYPEGSQQVQVLVGVASPSFQTSAAGVHINIRPEGSQHVQVLVGVASPSFQTSAAGVHIIIWPGHIQANWIKKARFHQDYPTPHDRPCMPRYFKHMPRSRVIETCDVIRKKSDYWDAI
ncbi:hypothetical protein Glove_199g99 [Diversispora epigaea]|uniref:Uncharacterized protein n=1 Tax=Diversispora epigaea TaxID=1348612 RepID=A0A397IN18_9GLOM|nr:hypothetical protein Glove_199g99 [Diversispora epigaea]